MKKSILLVTPPLLQPNAPYPATAYLAGYLRRKGFLAVQMDLSVELLNVVFSRMFLSEIFQREPAENNNNMQWIYDLREKYMATIDPVMTFLRGKDPTLANLICAADFLPQAGRFETMEEIGEIYGTMGVIDCAKYLSTLYLEDLTDYIRTVDAPGFELTKYSEKLSLSVDSFHFLEMELEQPANRVEQQMLSLLEARIAAEKSDVVGFSVPFPGNLLAAIRCAQHIRTHHPDTKIVLGGGYPTTELRSLTDKKIFRYVDHIILDDGEGPLEQFLSAEEPSQTFSFSRGKVTYSGNSEKPVSHHDRGCPDFTGLPHEKYFSLTDGINPMHRLWSDGRWNKLMAAHGCYWAKCAFCDTSLDYICRYDAVDAATLVDWMERVITQTGSRGFHFVDEALPPKILKEMALEILRRGLVVSWWGNIRFEPHYTADLCLLLAASGCIAVSGGVEVASDRLLALINKGATIEQLTLALRNFYYAGIMTHTYLMYGFPTQTLQDTVDSLEVVRQLFRAELIGSAYWHRYAMTVHSPSGTNPEAFGVRLKSPTQKPFANNEITFTENRAYSLEQAGNSLHAATYNYMRQAGFEKPAEKWFEGKVPHTQIAPTLITDHLIKPDASRIFSEHARLVYIGTPPRPVDGGLLFRGPSGEKMIKYNNTEQAFLIELLTRTADLNQVVTFGEAAARYTPSEGKDSGSFLQLYHAKRWDLMRGFGLLQV
ncbi:MAG: cobalamin-dependent protein [Rikenellaceae bacterium]|jgi:radical SAM superfamily enzyme YgiQ (UPF0313 family)|nr:cobalamin-dependent protein [Rikenellaceae bacterium]